MITSQLKKDIEAKWPLKDLFAKSRQIKFLVARSLYYYILTQKGIYINHIPNYCPFSYQTIYNSVHQFKTYYNHYPEYQIFINEICKTYSVDV